MDLAERKVDPTTESVDTSFTSDGEGCEMALGQGHYTCNCGEGWLFLHPLCALEVFIHQVVGKVNGTC